jgi:demethylmenaquinone methyltransferase/2-methoxy-6-polyprenyl-1,4-benzoquinol methylase
VALSGRATPVLDVCAGTGDFTLEWARAGGAAVGSDFCVPMLEIAGRKSAAAGLPASFVAADTLALPFPGDAFGTVSVAFGIRNVSDLRGGLRELRRVVRPGGEVVILEFTTPVNPLFRAVYLLYFLVVLPLVGNLVSGSGDGAYGYLPRSVRRFPGRDRLRRIMEEEGLTGVRVHDLSLGIVNALVGTKPRPEEGR